MTFSNSTESPDNGALRELRDEVKDLGKTLKQASKSSDRFSIAFAALALIQIIIGLFQFIFSVQAEEHRVIYALLWVVSMIGVIFWAGHSFNKINK